MTNSMSSTRWLAGTFAGYLALALYVLYVTARPASIALFWYANAFGTIAVLARPYREWPRLSAVLWAAVLVANWIMRGPGAITWMSPFANLLEIGLSAYLFRRFFKAEDCLTDVGVFMKALALSGVVPALVGALVSSSVLAIVAGASFREIWFTWFLGSAIGVISLLPLGYYLLARGARQLWRELRRGRRIAALAFALAVASWVPAHLPFANVYVTVALIVAATAGGFAIAAVGNFLCSLVLGALIAFGKFGLPTHAYRYGEFLSYLPVALSLVAPSVLAVAFERAEAQVRRLAEREAHFRGLYLRTPAMMISVDLTGRLAAVSEAWAVRMGYLPHEVVGRLLADFLTDTSRARYQAIVVPALLRDGSFSDRALRYVTRNGEVFDVAQSGILERDESGAPIGTLSVLLDVTEENRLQAELAAERALLHVTVRRLQTIVANVPAVIAYWGMDRRCEFGNSTHTEWFGVPVDDLSGMTATELLGPELGAFCAPHFEAALHGQSRIFEASFRDPGGRARHARICFLPDLDAGVQRGIFVFGTDTTALNHLVAERTRELFAAKEAAENANRIKDRIISNVSHEMRTPIHAITSFAELGRSRLSAGEFDKGVAYFGRIRASAGRLIQFVDALLELARLGAREIAARPVPTNVNALVGRVVEELRVLMDDRSISLVFRDAPDLPPANVDPHLIERVVTNLLSNAGKFSSERGTVEVTLSESTARDSARAFRIAVADRGIGIPEDELGSIFEPFVQSSRTDKRVGGTGLGLAIVRKIVELHGGRVVASNRAGGGALFEVDIPYAGPPPAEADPVPIARETVSA
jgi:PAS domain S-box-containing protein